ncbi:MAG: hypothetical protein JOZ14_00500 [Acidobacteria bacterium]|nr:hypothetical protein [Acidobacteriota bacterium]
MRVLHVLLLASLPIPRVQLPLSPGPKPPLKFGATAGSAPHKHGRWYFARNGHAVYCYGPVMTFINARGNLERKATFCRGDQLLVPLRD